MNPIRIYQGTDKTVNVKHDDPSLVSAQDIAIYIDSEPQIVKTLGNGVTGVTATNYVLTVAGEDTADIASGQYSIEALITTAGGRPVYGRMDPKEVIVINTKFTDTD